MNPIDTKYVVSDKVFNEPLPTLRKPKPVDGDKNKVDMVSKQSLGNKKITWNEFLETAKLDDDNELQFKMDEI